MSDVTQDDPNVHYRQSLTIWGGGFSAQMRDGTLAMHHYDGAPRSSEIGEPWLLDLKTTVLLRDMLNAATERGFLPEVPDAAT